MVIKLEYDYGMSKCVVCPKIRQHHKRNHVAIIIVMSNDIYAIRCKDPEYDNKLLTWLPIENL